MEFLRAHKRRSMLSETVYVLLNVGLAVAVLIMIWATGTPWLALTLVLLSKWRVLAVRPRYWFAHIESNMVDFIVNIGLVLLIYLAGQVPNGGGVAVQILLGILYAAWLLMLKPRTKRTFVSVQAAVAVFVGTMALASVSYEWPSSLVVLVMWVIGYASARHVLVAYSEEETRLLSIIWAFVAAELGWLTFHWTIAYPIIFTQSLKLPEMTIFLLGLSFLAERVYASYHKHEGIIKRDDILLPLIFTIALFVLIIIKYNTASIGAI